MRKYFSLGLLAQIALLAIICGGCTKNAKVARHMDRADRYYASGDYDKAEIEYINVLRLDPKSARAGGRIGTMCLEDGRLLQAGRFLAHACELDTNNVEFHEKLGLYFLSVSQLKKAREEANFVLDRQPENEEAPLLLADASATSSEVQASIKRLQQLGVPVAKQAPIDVALGNMALRLKDSKTALAEYDKARAAKPDFGELHAVLAKYYWLQKDLTRADQEFKAAITASPLRSVTRGNYAMFEIYKTNAPAAKAIFEEQAKKAPDYLPANIGLAQIAASETNLPAALVCLNKVLARDPDNYEALLLSGRYLLGQSNAPAATTQFEHITRVYPSDDSFLKLALAYKAQNNTPKAVAALNQALALNPHSAEAAIALAEIKLSSRDYNAAILSLRQVIKEHPEVPRAQLLLAAAYLGQGNFNDAGAIYRGWEKSYPTNWEVPLIYGAVLQQQHHNNEAREQFTRMQELVPDALQPVEKLIDLDIAEQKYPAALDRLQKYIAKRPDVREADLVMARIYLAQKDLKQAASVLENSIRAHPDFIPAYVMLANEYTSAKQTRPALEVTQKLLAKYPNQPGGLMLLAELSDDYKTSEKAYEKVLAETPENVGALNNLACLYAAHGELDKAYAMARKARELVPQLPSVADTLGWICYKRGDYQQAATLLQEAVGKSSDKPDVQMHAGMVAYMLGDEDRARPALQFAAQSKEDFPEKELATRSLAILAIDPKNADFSARDTLEKQIAEHPSDTIALNRLAAIYYRENKLDKAASTYESVLRYDPKNTKALIELAWMDSGRAEGRAKALELAKAAYKVAPDDADVSHTLGRIAFLSGDDKMSYDLLKDTARKRPSDAELQYDLAEAAYSQGKVDEAQTGMRNALEAGAAFSRTAKAKRFLEMVPLTENAASAIAAAGQVNQALKADPEYVPALMAAGLIDESKNDSAAARQDYEKALSRYPDFVPAKYRMAILLAQQPGDDKRAYEFATQAYQAYPNDPELGKALGIIGYRTGDYSSSARYLKESASRKTSDAQLMYYLGMAQYKLSDKANSKKNLLQAINLKLPDNMATEAKKVLAQLN